MVTRYTHVSIQADDLEESVEFYRDAFDMELIPTPDFEEPLQWLRCGEIQLHIVENDAEPPTFNHHAVHVDDFERTYRAVLDHDTAEGITIPPVDAGFVDGHPPVYVLPNDEVQFYITDPAGNMVEIDHPNADEIDESVVQNMVERADVRPPGPGEPWAGIYQDSLVAQIEQDESA